MKPAILVSILLSISFLLDAQPAKRPVPQLEFASLDSNRIILGDSLALEGFFEKMDSVFLCGGGSLRILHVGGSHVQGGTMTRAIRNAFLGDNPELDGGRGFVFPYSVAKTNTPSSYKSQREGLWTASKCTQRMPDKRLGLSGMAVTTSDTAAFFKIILESRNPVPEDVHAGFETMRVLGYADGDRSPVIFREEGDTLRPEREDSCWIFRFPARMDSVKVGISGSPGEFTLTGIYLDNEGPGITVSEVGVNGASLKSYFKCDDFERDLALVAPDLVIFAIGINDAIAEDFSEAVFKERYKEMVRHVRSVNPDCAIIFVTNNDSFRYSRKRGYRVNDNGPRARHAFLELGEECGAGVWDAFEIMGGLGSMKKWEEAGLAKRDKIHFTDDGYFILGNLFFNALIDRYMEHMDRSND